MAVAALVEWEAEQWPEEKLTLTDPLEIADQQRMEIPGVSAGRRYLRHKTSHTALPQTHRTFLLPAVRCAIQMFACFSPCF
jgi:hypothetical protein